MKFKDLFLIPNLITISRLLITIYIFTSTSADEFINTNLVLLIALIGISDSVDGIVARKLNQVSKLGIILDPITDRIVFVLLVLWLTSFFEPIFLIMLIIRELLVSLGGLYVLKAEKTVKVTNNGKLGTTLIFISICLGVLNNDINTVFIDFFMYISLIFYYFVALEYLYNLNKK